ncbi:Uu.00g079340.m01.CDS01 [Anthostomella pinea]|uniref:Carboxylic ester hydrolase n=1 Tax=Anthostomella pinea TaxID=933095 RepID=A0AAI8VKV5_9PEZI|nr:Uu.00g079340.m01.CDS01 [Anthostomella pinea]
MRTFLPLATIAASAAAAASISRRSDPTVDLGYVTHQGHSNSRGVDEFLGLRFAAPPLGDLRWRAPADPEPVAGVQNATVKQAVCVGQDKLVVAGVTEEDCLYVNSYTPSKATANPDAKLPVWVYLQGGGYQTNSGGNYNGTEVIVQSGYDIVHVNVNYRVAQLGFLGGVAVVEGGGDYNVGLLDQWKALEWVQEHIEQFGGDPDQVVLHGPSAGAGAVSHIMTAYDGVDHGLFVGTIGDAFAWGVGAYPNDTDAHFAMFSSQMGCANATDQMACLRATDINKIQTFDRNAAPPAGVPTPNMAMWFSPLIDGVFVTGPQQDSFSQGKFVKVPMITGDATNEGNTFAPNASTTEEVTALAQLEFVNLTDAQIDTIVAAYDHPRPLPQHAAYFSVVADILGEFGFICPVNKVSMGVAAHLSPDQVWNYRWNTTEQLEVDMGWEAWHTSDIIPFFGPGQASGPDGYEDLDIGYSFYPGGENAAIVPVLQHYLISFIKNLDPNVERYAGSPEWENWGEGLGQRLRIQTNATAMEEVPQDQVDRCNMFWDLNDIMKQ